VPARRAARRRFPSRNSSASSPWASRRWASAPSAPAASANKRRANRFPVDGPRAGRLMAAMRATLHQLEQTIAQRRSADPSQSYVAKLTSRGRGKIAQKVGEEAVETVIAALAGDRAETVGESADLLFHLLVLLADCGIS